MLISTLAVVATATAAWQLVHRTSPLVRRWQPSAFHRRSAGPLSVLDSGAARHHDQAAIVLLHGLGATGEYFGAFYDALSRRRRVVIVDLLGFGHSLDEQRVGFDLDDHVAALDDALDALDLGESHIVVAAHSMSSAIALTWADRNDDRAEHVYLWGPPIYPTEAAAQSVANEYGFMGRLFALDTKWAERACRINCINRDVSGRLMALMAPRWPVPVSSEASRHTWAAYHQSLRHLVLDVDWSSILPGSVPVTIFHGTEDAIGDQAHIATLVGSSNVVNVPGADHHVALQHPDLLVDALDR